MTTNFDDVGDFHEKFGLHRVPAAGTEGIGPQPWDDDLIQFRINFLNEELKEFIDAADVQNHGLMFDALIDLVYVALGTAHMLGYPWQVGWTDVQRANMAKVRAAKDGSDSVRGSAWDVVKPPGWQPADIGQLLRHFGFDTPRFNQSAGTPKVEA